MYDNLPYLGVGHIKDFVILSFPNTLTIALQNDSFTTTVFPYCVQHGDDDLRVHYYMSHSCHGFATHDHDIAA